MSAFMSNHDFTPALSHVSTSGKPGLFASIARSAASVTARLAAMQQRRAMIAELSNLSDHELADIGISRSDISRAVDPGFAAQKSAMRRAGGVSSRVAAL